jgi:hypothetical protein
MRRKGGDVSTTITATDGKTRIFLPIIRSNQIDGARRREREADGYDGYVSKGV